LFVRSERAFLDLYDSAFATNLLQKDIEQIIPVTFARVSYERRRIEATTHTFHPAESQIPPAGKLFHEFCRIPMISLKDENTFATIIVLLESGLEMVRNGNLMHSPPSLSFHSDHYDSILSW
jgi:hypothetical protein